MFSANETVYVFFPNIEKKLAYIERILIITLQEKISLLRENEQLKKDNKRLIDEKESMRRNKEVTDNHIVTLTKSLEIAHKDLKDKENLVLFRPYSLL